MIDRASYEKEEGVVSCVGHNSSVSDCRFNGGVGWPSDYFAVSRSHHPYSTEFIRYSSKMCDKANLILLRTLNEISWY